MKKLFLYEFVTGGGFLEFDGKPLPNGSLLTEGEAMWRAAYEDFTSLGDLEVHSLRDARLPEVDRPGVITVDHFARESFFNLCVSCDYCLLIAPEFDDIAASLTDRVEMLGTPLLGPDTRFIRLAADKTATSNTLHAGGIRVPPGQKLEAGEAVPMEFSFPAVAKVNDGAGSMVDVLEHPPSQAYPHVTRLEQMVYGTACSISFFCQTDAEPIACPPMRQILSSDGKLTYLGGQRLMDRPLIARATNLGRQVIKALPPTRGYVGIDLVLADDASVEDNSRDYVIEVNPRLTTSYIGLREIAKANLAGAMIDIAEGRQPEIAFSDHSIQFQADGMVRQ